MEIGILESLRYVGSESSHGTKGLFNLPPLVVKARHLSDSAFCTGFSG